MLISENNVNYKDVGKECVQGNVEGVVAHFYNTVAQSYTVYGSNGRPVVIALETGVHPGGPTRFMAADGTTQVAAGEIIVAINA